MEMIGGLSGIGRFLGLVADLVRQIVRAVRARAAQKSHDAIERDPAGEFIHRYGGVRDEQKPGTDSAADPGER